ncbi:MAG: 50S ribosomal protein L13 [SAR202 cluster bacterium]|nr:50S ribosomal protein L13 [SAR202 cluster bacterium]
MKRISTYFPKQDKLNPQWRVIDATGQTLGRLARNISIALQGKDRPDFSPHLLTGDYVVVVNAAKLKVTGRKPLQKIYYRHSGYVGNMRSFTLRNMMENHPERVLQLAVKGMLPANHRGREMMGRLKVYAGEQHPHQGQIKTPSTGNEG